LLLHLCSFLSLLKVRVFDFIGLLNFGCLDSCALLRILGSRACLDLLGLRLLGLGSLLRLAQSCLLSVNLLIGIKDRVRVLQFLRLLGFALSHKLLDSEASVLGFLYQFRLEFLLLLLVDFLLLLDRVSSKAHKQHFKF